MCDRQVSAMCWGREVGAALSLLFSSFLRVTLAAELAELRHLHPKQQWEWGPSKNLMVVFILQTFETLVFADFRSEHWTKSCSGGWLIWCICSNAMVQTQSLASSKGSAHWGHLRVEPAFHSSLDLLPFRPWTRHQIQLAGEHEPLQNCMRCVQSHGGRQAAKVNIWACFYREEGIWHRKKSCKLCKSHWANWDLPSPMASEC